MCVSERCSFISLPTVDLSLPIVWAMAVLDDPLVMPVRIIRRSSKVKCEKELLALIYTCLSNGCQVYKV